MRRWSRRRCSSVEMWRKTFTIVVPSSTQHPLELADVTQARAPHRLGRERSHPDRDHVLVVGSVEDAHLAVTGTDLVHAPQEVVRGVATNGRLERGHPATLRVHT